MDLVYIPELFTYGYLRNPQYHDYEQSWNRDYSKCDSRKSVENQRTVQQQSKENCHLCKEMKRRNLAVYIRSKSRSDSCHEGIQEEEENDNERKIVDADRNKSAKSSCGAEKS
ncbi:hypothetical protein ALC60_04749 [Trachymyrmex zeteki]|uniref:Uncharacterized protein n=1 Tax=Mycetomoellerius zeteki TaxID=64791 RepID=A0A151X7J2_9HYME|nr:PREDICTED: uncharacterized protein LOC108721914 [Trachymyrmex zeteki]KYQ56342.1 hypothetical protein ALC60_04749 [Trachymyrmex zeteki]